MDKISLTELATALNAAGYTAPSYRNLYHAVLDGVLADYIERVNGHYYTSRAHIPKIAAQLGLYLRAKV